MRHTRRHFLAGAATLALAHGGGPLRAWGQPRKSTRLILLGTKGGPRVGGQRRNPSTLMLINDVPYVVDCGTSTSQQLLAAGVALNRLRYVFLTHLHSDHMLEYGPLGVQRLGRRTSRPRGRLRPSAPPAGDPGVLGVREVRRRHPDRGRGAALIPGPCLS